MIHKYSDICISVTELCLDFTFFLLQTICQRILTIFSSPFQNATLEAERQATQAQLRQLEGQSESQQAQILALQRQAASLQENNTALQTHNANLQVP